MGEFSITHLLLVAIVVLVFFGPSRLPGLGQSLGKAIRGFKDGLEGDSTAGDRPRSDPASQVHGSEAQPLPRPSEGSTAQNGPTTVSKNDGERS